MNFVLTSLGDVGGQKTLRSYWRNYFEKTDALIWVVDATDRMRIDDCRAELNGLLLEEVVFLSPYFVQPEEKSANESTAAFRSKSTCLCKQDRC